MEQMTPCPTPVTRNNIGDTGSKTNRIHFKPEQRNFVTKRADFGKTKLEVALVKHNLPNRAISAVQLQGNQIISKIEPVTNRRGKEREGDKRSK